MISHQEAEILTSARQDAPLDPVVERELQAHLATCDQCRAFAAATERLTAGLRSLPTTPASPRVRREVMEQVNAGRNPLVALLTGNSSASFGTTLSTLAAVLLIGVIGWFALDRLYFDSNNGNENNQIAAVPTEVPANVFNATSTLEATDAPVPTATSETKATEIPSPTVTSEPTATTPPTPTATLVPTSTTAPTATSASTEVPVDLTVPQETAAVRSAKEPTATATEKATVAPTTVPPTQTPAPTQTPEPTQTQAIEPIDGSTTNAEDETATSESERTTAASTGEAGENNPGIELIDPGDGTEGAVEDVPNETTNADAIEPIGSDEEATPGVGGSGDTALVEADQSEAGTTSLMDASVSYNMIDGDPSNHLGLTAEGRMIFTNVPDGATFTTSDGYTMRSADSQPGVVEICTDSYCEPALETPEDGSWQQDVPMGVSGTTAYVLRIYSDRSEVIVGTPQGTQIVDPAVVLDLGPTSSPAASYDSDGTIYAWLPSGEWLIMSGGDAYTTQSGYPNPTLVRFAPSGNDGPLVGYFSGNTLVVAYASDPGSALLTLNTEGVDFDISPPGDQVAVIRGNDIVIYDMQGNEKVVYEGGDSQPGSVLWLRSGLVWVDRTSGLLFQIPDTAP